MPMHKLQTIPDQTKLHAVRKRILDLGELRHSLDCQAGVYGPALSPCTCGVWDLILLLDHVLGVQSYAGEI